MCGAGRRYEVISGEGETMDSNPLKWHGGKSYLANRIIELMPKHTHYVEPFFGGGAVLFAKPCEGVSEVVNDLNRSLIGFWKVLQDERMFAKMVRILEAVPFSSLEHSYATYWDKNDAPRMGMTRVVSTDETVGRAVNLFIRYRQSRQGLGKDFATLSRNRTRRGMNEQVSSWLSAIEGLPEAHERLKRVVILNDRACTVIKQQDGENTFFYCDPPYLHETRVTKSDYECEMSEAEHAGMLGVLSAIKGKFILSGYRSELYDKVADAAGWRRVDIEIDNKASSKKTKDTKTECLWMNC